MLISRDNGHGVRGTAFGRKPNSAALQAVSLERDSGGESQSLCNTQPSRASLAELNRCLVPQGHVSASDPLGRAGKVTKAACPVQVGPAHECFQPSFPAKSHGNRLGFPSVQDFHGEDAE